ncbi:MAG: G8 domain-containing protein [Bacteroidota bacterium]
MNKKSLLYFLLNFLFLISSYADNSKNNWDWKEELPMCATMSNEAAYSATIRPIANGLWYQKSIWPNGRLPTINDNVVIPAGRNVVMAGSCRARKIEIQGVLRAVNWQTGGAWINLQTKAVHVLRGGRFEIGTKDRPYLAECNIILTGNNPNEELCAAMGTKFIGAMAGGTVEIHGQPQISWTNLRVTAPKGATSISLQQPVNWRVGDKLVLTSSSQNWQEVDEVTIKRISSNKRVITLTTPLKFTHIGGQKTFTRRKDGKRWTANIFAEVGLLSHNITIQGDETSASNGFGGHIMAMKGSVANIENAELYHMGQKSKMGRYPFHWHLCENQARGQFFKNNSVNKSFNRAITIHGTDYTTVEGNVAYDHIGHGIFLEDGGERFNTIKRNLVFTTRRPKKGEELTPSDNQANQAQNRTPSSYWITNANNYFIGNVAAGTEGTGFWVIQPETPMGPSKNIPYYANLRPHTEPLGSFDGFVVHSCANGFDFFDRLNPDHSLKTNWGWAINKDAVFKNGLFYANGQAIYCGLDVGGNPNRKIIQNCVFTDNKTITMLAADMVLDNCVFASTSNVGIPTGYRAFYRFYDGPGIHRNCHFSGWNKPDEYLIGKDGIGGATVFMNPTFQNTSWEELGVRKFVHRPYGLTSNSRFLSLTFRDLDGSFLGKARTTFVLSHPFNVDGHEYVHPSWENGVRSDYHFAMLYNKSGGGAQPSIAIGRTKPGTQEVLVPPVSFNHHYQAPLICDQGFLYTLYYQTLPANRSIDNFLRRAERGASYTTRYQGFGKLSGLRVVNGNVSITRVNSLGALNAARQNAYYIQPNGDLYIKRVKVNASLNAVETINIGWSGTGSYRPANFDNDGDGVLDPIEALTCRNGNDASDLAFNFNRSTEGFAQNDISATNTNSSESWLLRSDFKRDPFIYKTGLSFPGSQVKKIRVRTYSEVAGTYQLFWGNENGGFRGGVSKTVNYPTRRKWVELEFDMTGNPNWEGKTITALRLDFPAGPNGRYHYWVDYIKGPRGGENDVDGDGICNDKDDSDGDGATDAFELNNCRNPLDPKDLALNFNGTTEAFRMNQISAHNTASGVNWLLRADFKNDPFIYKGGFKFKGSDVKKIRVRTYSEAAGTYQLFWGNEDGGFRGGVSKTVSYPTRRKWVELEFDMTGNPHWDGKTITALRLDFPVNTKGRIHTWVDYIVGEGGNANDVNGNGICNDKEDSDGDGATDAFELSNCRNPLDPKDLALNFNNTREGFKMNKITANTLGGKTHWLLRSDFQNDPFIYKTGLKMDGNKIKKIKVWTRCQTAGVYQLFWGNETGGFRGGRSVTVSYPQANKWVEIVFDPSNHPDWKNHTITAIRVDFPVNTRGQIHTWIDYIVGDTGNANDRNGDDICDSNGNAQAAASSRQAPQLSFTAFPANREVELQWLTNTGYKNERFEIERSTDGIQFDKIAEITNDDDSEEMAYFQNVDSQPITGTNYYRIKQIYWDGTYDYTEIQQVDFAIDVEALSVFPNPAQNEVFISLKPYLGKKGLLTIFNQYGQVAKKQSLSTIDNPVLQINTAEFENGLYFINLQIDQNKTLTRKVLIKRLY